MHAGECLSPDQQLALVHAFNEYACEGRHEEGEDLAGEADDAKQKCRTGEPVNEPTGGESRHPGADERDALAGEEELEVAMTHGAPCVREAAGGCRLGG